MTYFELHSKLLMCENDLQSFSDILKMPTYQNLPEGEFTLLTAAAGDTPSSVAAACGMRAEEFVLFNGEVVFPGQALLVRKKQA